MESPDVYSFYEENSQDFDFDLSDEFIDEFTSLIET